MGFLLVIGITGWVEYSTGKSLLCPDGLFGWWESSVLSSENSQRVADAYTFSHIIHGMLFYGFLWCVTRRVPMKYRFIIALVMEAAWELLENSPIIIDRYRATTTAQGYVGDSVLNSVFDIIFAGFGFVISKYSKFWISVALIVLMEVGCFFWVRDNLTLNISCLRIHLKQ